MATISARLSAFWLAWKWVVILSIALGLSLWGNWTQLKRGMTADLRLENKDLRDAVTAYSRIASERTRDDAALLAKLDLIHGTTRSHFRAYTSAAQRKPLAANCAPGAERVDAVNRALGPLTPTAAEPRRAINPDKTLRGGSRAAAPYTSPENTP